MNPRRHRPDIPISSDRAAHRPAGPRGRDALTPRPVQLTGTTEPPDRARQLSADLAAAGWPLPWQAAHLHLAVSAFRRHLARVAVDTGLTTALSLLAEQLIGLPGPAPVPSREQPGTAPHTPENS